MADEPAQKGPDRSAWPVKENQAGWEQWAETFSTPDLRLLVKIIDRIIRSREDL
jgi:hypothetical protein